MLCNYMVLNEEGQAATWGHVYMEKPPVIGEMFVDKEVYAQFKILAIAQPTDISFLLTVQEIGEREVVGAGATLGWPGEV